MDIEKKINDLVEEYEVFYSGTIWEFLAHKDIHLHSKIANLVKYNLFKEDFYSYHLSKVKCYLKAHPQMTFKDLCSKDSLWYW